MKLGLMNKGDKVLFVNDRFVAIQRKNGEVDLIPFFFNGFFKANVSFGGTSLIIIASVILETLKQIESMMLVRNYKGFLND